MHDNYCVQICFFRDTYTEREEKSDDEGTEREREKEREGNLFILRAKKVAKNRNIALHSKFVVQRSIS